MDAVVIGSILSVVGAIVIVVYLGYKISKLMSQDADRSGKT